MILRQAKKYADDVKNLIEYATPGKVAAFIAESIQGVGGFVEFPQGYLKHTYEHIRAAGGVCIADEVQPVSDAPEHTSGVLKPRA